jgi:hypothetical protein
MSKPKSKKEGAEGDHNAPIVEIKSKFEWIDAACCLKSYDTLGIRGWAGKKGR